MNNAIDLSKYIFLHEKKHGNHEHPPVRVSKRRLSLKDPDPVLRKLDSYEWIKWSAEKYSSPAKSLFEPNGYLGYLDWPASHQILQNMEPAHIILSPIRFIDFLQLLSSGEANDGNGNEVPKKELGYILEQIIGNSNCPKSEYLDMQFKYENDVFKANYYHHIADGKLIPGLSEPLEEYLTEEVRNMDLSSWLNNPSIQGLPKSKNSDEPKINLYYNPPKDNRVATFRSASFTTVFDCDVPPYYQAPVQGVRPVLPCN